MKLTISLFNKGLIINNIKRFWWVSVLYFISLIIIYPVRFLMYPVEYSSGKVLPSYQIFDYTTLISSSAIHGFFIMGVPVIVAVLMFHFMHKTKDLALFSSLPISKNQLFFNQTFSGMLLWLVPVILNGLLLIILRLTINYLSCLYTTKDIVIMTGIIVLLEFMIYGAALFVGMLTGTSISHFIFTYALYFVPVGIYFAVKNFLSYMLIGFITNIYNPDPLVIDMLPGIPLLKAVFIYRLIGRVRISSPAIRYGEKPYHFAEREYTIELSSVQLIIYFCVAVLFIFAALYLFKKRNPEKSGDIITFGILRPIFKYATALAFTLIGSIIVMGIINYKTNVLLLLVWAFVGYFPAEMLLRKSFNVWHSYKGFLIFSAIIVSLFLIVSYDVFGFVNGMPNVKDVKSVYIGGSDQYVNNDFYEVANTKNGYIGTDFNELSNIEYVEKLQRMYIGETRQYLVESKRSTYMPNMYVVYTLKNGLKVSRGYYAKDYNSNTADFNSKFEPLMVSDEYIKKRNAIVYKYPEEIDWIVLNGGKKISDKNEIMQLIPLLQEDLLNVKGHVGEKLPYFQLCYGTGSSIKGMPSNIISGGAQIAYDIPPDGKIMKWLQEHQ